MKFRPTSCAALPVVPVPMNGSRTVSPGNVYSLISLCGISAGNVAGCSGCDAPLMLQTSCVHCAHSCGVTSPRTQAPRPAPEITPRPRESLAKIRIGSEVQRILGPEGDRYVPHPLLSMYPLDQMILSSVNH